MKAIRLVLSRLQQTPFLTESIPDRILHAPDLYLNPNFIRV
ncbi:hypothetical protein Hdeb2414_s0016g00476511 [Helianthus debilis subsp. tardiflorus]